MLTVEIDGVRQTGRLIVIYSQSEPICLVHEISPDFVVIFRQGDEGFNEFLRKFYKLNPSYKVHTYRTANPSTILQDIDLLKRLANATGSSG